MVDLKLAKSLILLVDIFRQVLIAFPLLSQELANEIMDFFLNAIPHPLKQRLLLLRNYIDFSRFKPLLCGGQIELLT